jgi:hypothetical protein
MDVPDLLSSFLLKAFGALRRLRLGDNVESLPVIEAL